MKPLCMLGAGLVGALLGAAAWVAVVYFANIEAGIIAILVGVLAGFGVSFGARGAAGTLGGVIALGCALIGLLVGKLALVSIIVGPMAVGGVHEEEAISYVADVVAREYEAEGKPVSWPRGSSPDGRYQEADYPADVWAEAETRWNAYGEGERERYMGNPMLIDKEYIVTFIADDVVMEYEEAGRALNWPPGADQDFLMSGADYPEDVWAEAWSRWEAMTPEERIAHEDGLFDAGGLALIMLSVFLFSFSLWDVLWFGLAGVAAWRIGSGAERGS